MKQWQARCGDTLAVPQTNQAYEKIDISGRPHTPDEFQPEWIVKKYF